MLTVERGAPKCGDGLAGPAADSARAIACVPAAGTPFGDRCLWQIVE